MLASINPQIQTDNPTMIKSYSISGYLNFFKYWTMKMNSKYTTIDHNKFVSTYTIKKLLSYDWQNEVHNINMGILMKIISQCKRQKMAISSSTIWQPFHNIQDLALQKWQKPSYMFFFPFRWTQRVLPKIHLRRSMMVCNSTKACKANNYQWKWFIFYRNAITLSIAIFFVF